MSPYAVFCGAVAVRLAVGKRICSRDLHNKGLGRKVLLSLQVAGQIDRTYVSPGPQTSQKWLLRKRLRITRADLIK